MKLAVRALMQVAQELAESCMAAAPALRSGEKVTGESYHKGLYTRLSTYNGDQYIFNYRFKKGGGGVAHHFCVKSSSPQLAFVM